MKIISHRGNISGPNTASKGENHPDSIRDVIADGFQAEIDLRIIDSQFWLGHDSPDFKINDEFIFGDNLWIHAKNFEAFDFIANYASINGFYHQNDDYTLTTQGFIWTFPRKETKLGDLSIGVLPELIPEWDLAKCYGVCTDFVYQYGKKSR